MVVVGNLSSFCVIPRAQSCQALLLSSTSPFKRIARVFVGSQCGDSVVLSIEMGVVSVAIKHHESPYVTTNSSIILNIARFATALLSACLTMFNKWHV